MTPRVEQPTVRTGNFGFKKIDANDPALAPYGLLIRTNHSFTGTTGEGGGYIRFTAATEALNLALAQNRLDPQYLINSLSRNLTHGLTRSIFASLPANAKPLRVLMISSPVPQVPQPS
ncbi:MAG: hypothetical protein R2758_08265 [Bacteroidales bacterium]